MKKIILAHILYLIGFSSIAQFVEFKLDHIVDSVFCISDGSQSYALYLPPQYDPKDEWPAIFIFEPAARGKLPVTKFLSPAKELGYILISSNNSKNGFRKIAFDAANAMFEDGFKRFNIDSSRVYTSGFSGGSRVASAIAVKSKNIAGVIGCGAGFSNSGLYPPSSDMGFVYVGIVGEKDMNYLEHVELEDDLNNLDIANHRIVYHAGHQWPNAIQLREAMLWLELYAFKAGKKSSSNFQEEMLFDVMKQRADSLFRAERILSAYQVYEQLIQYFEGVLNCDSIRNQTSIIESLKQFKRLNKKEEKMIALEKQYQYKVGIAFREVHETKLKATYDSTLKTKKWWYNEIDSLKSRSKLKDTEKSNLAFRALNLIWAKFAETSFYYERIEDYETAIILSEVWLHTQPQNVWPLWNMAKLHAKNNEVNQAVKYLYKAYDNGMKYKSSINSVEFDSLRGNLKYEALKEKLVAKAE